MFTLQADSIITEMRQKAVLTANQRRKDDARRKIDFFNDEQFDYILEQIAATYKSPERITPVSVNIVKKIIRLLSTVYIQDAVRTVDGTKQDQQVYSSIEDSASLPIKMKLCNRLTRLCGNTLLRPVWRNERMDLDILTPDICDVYCGDSAEDLVAVMITQFSDSGRQVETQYSLWTAETVQRLDYRFNLLAEEPNPYGALPFVPTFASPPTDNFWLPGANDLIGVQDAINRRLTDLWYTLDFQSSAVFYASGVKAPVGVKPGQGVGIADVAVGPGSAIFLPEHGKIGFESPNAPIAETLAAVEFLMKQAAITNGLPAGSVSLEPTDQSGVSRIVANSELEELRMDDIASFARVEQQLFNIFRTVWNVHRPQQQISTASTLRTDFYDPQPVTSPLDQTKEWQALLELGLVSPVDILIQRNPDLSRDDAKAELLRIRDELKEFHSINFA